MSHLGAGGLSGLMPFLVTTEDPERCPWGTYWLAILLFMRKVSDIYRDQSFLLSHSQNSII